MVRHKIWQGYWNQGPEDLGEQIYDFSTRYFETLKEAEDFLKSFGRCDCCHNLPEKLELDKWYLFGYADEVILREAKK